MPSDAKLELVITVDGDKANAEIKRLNQNLDDIGKHGKQAGDHAGGALDHLTGKIAAGAAVGEVLAGTFEKLVEVAKEFAVEATKLAAHNEFVAATTEQLARIHGLSAAAVKGHAQAIKLLGFHDSEALTVVNRMIVAELDLTKATQLAEVAKNAAALRGISREEALDRILSGIEANRSRTLRSMGILVNLEEQVALAELRRGRALTDTEKRQIALNAVIEKGSGLQGVAAEAGATVEGSMMALGRSFHELKEELGNAFLPTLRDLVGGMGHLLQAARENKDVVADVVKGLTVLGGAAVLLKGAALAGIPVVGQVAAGLAVLGGSLYFIQQRFNQSAEEAFRFRLEMGNEEKALEGVTQAALEAKKAGRFQPLTGAELGLTVELPKPPRQLTAEELRKIQEAEKSAHEFLLNAITQEFDGLAKVYNQQAKQIDLYGNSKKAIDDINQATVIGVQREQRKMGVLLAEDSIWQGILGHATKLEHLRDKDNQQLFPMLRVTLEDHNKRFEEQREFEQKSLELHLETLDKQFDFETEVQQQIRDARLRNLELVGAQTLRDQLAVEQQRAAIEIDYVNREARIHADAINRRKERELSYLQFLKFVRPDLAKQIDDRVEAVTQQAAEDARQNEIKRLGAIDAAREQAAVRSAQLIREHLRSTFESLKQSAGGVFDALLHRSESVFGAIGNALKTAVLTALKEIVTSQVAAALMRLLYGVRVSFAGGLSGNVPVFGGEAGAAAGGGLLGRLGTLLGIGAVPVFGAGGGIIGSPAAPGGTPTLTGVPITLSGSSGGIAGVSNVAGLAGLFGGLKNFLGLGSNSVQVAPGVAIARTGISGNLQAIGKSDAALVGGALLALDGLRRGGAVGVAETTAGGALIGFKVGGPIGAAIGASAGFFAGIIRLFVKGAMEKARDKIKAIYGVDIPDKGILQQIVDMAKQGFGGNLDVAIRSQQVRDLIELYAMSTGQNIARLPASVRPASLVELGGGLFQAPTFQNGSALAFQSPLPTLGPSTLDRILPGTPSNAGPPVITLGDKLMLQVSINGNSAAAALRGEAVQAVIENPRAVQSAAIDAARSNAGRREMLALQLSPGTLTS